MAVNLKAIYDDIIEQLGTGISSTKLNNAFPRATNRALNQLENRADTGTDFTAVAGIGDSITQLDAKHEYILYAGIMFWLQRAGFANGDPRVAAAMLKDSSDLWKEAIGAYIKDAVATEMADGTTDVIGQGYLGS